VLLSGGILYGNWCSPEMVTAAALLAGRMLFVRAPSRVRRLCLLFVHPIVRMHTSAVQHAIVLT
jgi:hypothetical protein